MIKILEGEVEKLNQSNTIFNLTKSKKNINKSNSESDKLLIEHSFNQKHINKYTSNVKHIDFLLETAEYRKTSIERINFNVAYIKKINEDMNNIVSKQSDIVVNIADNIVTANKNSKETYYNLQEILNKNKYGGSRKCYIVMLVIALFFFLILIIVNKLTR